jgi:hypothetical protein
MTLLRIQGILIISLFITISCRKDDLKASIVYSYECSIERKIYYWGVLNSDTSYVKNVEIILTDSSYIVGSFVPWVDNEKWHIPLDSLNSDGYYKDWVHLGYREIDFNPSQFEYYRYSGDDLGKFEYIVTGIY